MGNSFTCLAQVWFLEWRLRYEYERVLWFSLLSKTSDLASDDAQVRYVWVLPIMLDAEDRGKAFRQSFDFIGV